MIYISRADQRQTFGHGLFEMDMIRPGKALGNAKDLGLGPLGRIDHARLKPGVVIGMHPHVNDEILSYLRRGKMYHEDSMGEKTEVCATNLMMMNAGSGIYHEESIPAKGEEVEMLQIFIRPQVDNLIPHVQFQHFKPFHLNEWRLIGGPSKAPLEIRSEIYLYDTLLEGATIEIPKLNALTGYLYIFSGHIQLSTEEYLQKGDGVIIRGDQISISSRDKAELVFFLLDEQASYTRSGMFSGY